MRGSIEDGTIPVKLQLIVGSLEVSGGIEQLTLLASPQGFLVKQNLNRQLKSESSENIVKYGPMVHNLGR